MKILDSDPKENAKKQILKLKKDIEKYQAIIDKEEDLFDKILKSCLMVIG